ncbi:MAG: hypothetical protein KDJ77_18425 [Rhodobiaceae bacterium]|nr:hypothetical protein [Rhodobiaceae bacterium]
MMQTSTAYAASALSSLRAERRPVARLVLAIMVLPIWLTLMASLSPSAAMALGQEPATIGTICTANGARPADDNAGIAPTACLACHTICCIHFGATLPDVAFLLDVRPDHHAVFPRSFAAQTAIGHEPPTTDRPRAPPLFRLT